MSIPTGVDGDAPVRARKRPTSVRRWTRSGGCTPMSMRGLPGRPTSPRRRLMERSSLAPPSNGPVTASPSSRPSTP